MYGMLLESVQHYLQLKYGKDFWDRVCLHAGVTNKVFVTHECYSDSLITRIAKACSAEVVNSQTTNDFMEFFGRCFLRFSSHYGYDRILKVYGREFREFLHGIDNLHEHMRFGFPRLQAPSFRCEQETSTGITLHYRSKRQGYKMYVVGQLKECAQLFFNMDIELQVIKESGSSSENDRTKSHVVYRVLFDNTRYMSVLRDPIAPFKCADIPVDVLFNIFPFSFVLNDDLTFQKSGEGLSNYLGYSIDKMNINDVFTLRRPIATLTWAKLIRNDKIMFELISRRTANKQPLHSKTSKEIKLIPVIEASDGMTTPSLRTPSVQKHKFQTVDESDLPLEAVTRAAFKGILKQQGNNEVQMKQKVNFEPRSQGKDSRLQKISENEDKKNTLVNDSVFRSAKSATYSTETGQHSKLVMSKSSNFALESVKREKEEFSDDTKKFYESPVPRRAYSLGDQFLPRSSEPDFQYLLQEGAEKKPLHLKGQMLYIAPWKKILFIGSPIIGTLEDLRETGLYLNDLSMYDGSRQMVLAGTQKLSQLELSRDMETLYGKMLQETAGRLDKEIHKSEQLLYSLMPKEIAERLRNGETQIDTCETFDDVTILFGYIEGFDVICESAEPMLVVKLINEIFSVFDRLTERHNVYKFETLGDAIYMLVSGAPVPAKSHAHEMANMALDMLQEVKSIKTPVDGKPLELRIGMHSGPVVAGVIGEKTPQYCLFGNTVNMASRMQSTGESMKIHISKETASRLLPSVFKIEYRGSISVKGVGDMETFWLSALQQQNRKDEGV